MAITEKQKRFVDEYLIDLNATQAAIRAGYDAKWAKTNTTKLLTNTNIEKYLQERQKDLQKRTEITQDDVLRELAKIGFASIRNAAKWGSDLGIIQNDDGSVVMTNGVQLLSSDELDESTAASISEISQTAQGIKLKMYDKRAALVDIGRHLGMFTDKLNIGGQPDNPVSHKVVFEVLNGIPSKTH